MKISPTVIIVIVTLALAGVGYWFFLGPGEQAPLTSTDPLLQNPAQQRFQTLASQLQSIKFETSIFTDPHFNALVDLTTQITPESSGRIDPFAPLPGSSPSTASGS